MKPHSEWCEDPNCPLRIVERGGVAGVGLEDQLNRLQNLPFENDPCANQPPQPAELPKVGDPVECISSETNWEFVRCSVMETDATGFWARDPNEDVTRWLLTDENPSEGHIGWRRVSGLPKIGETVEVWQDGGMFAIRSLATSPRAFRLHSFLRRRGIQPQKTFGKAGGA